MNQPVTRTTLAHDLRNLGLQPGSAVMLHSSFRSIGISDPEILLAALFDTLGPQGSLLVPALSWEQQPPTVHDNRSTPSCVGFLAEYVRSRPGTRRSLHPTHSVCALGANTGAWLDRHAEDTTPCGPNSPFTLLAERGGSILMLGCGLRPNTSMHAIEELAPPPYLFGSACLYQITDATGHRFAKHYITHDFAGVAQRYDRIEQYMQSPELRTGQVGQARAYLIDAVALRHIALTQLQHNPWAFVERVA